MKPGEADLPSRAILVRFREQGRNLFYRPIMCGFPLRVAGLELIVFDVAVLAPVEAQDKPFDHLVANIHPPRLGDELYMAGYSDEVAFPFGLDRHLNSDELKEQQRLGINAIIGGTMIKRGVVGNVTVGSASLSDGRTLNITRMYLDNHVHSGASGGPIVDENGKARGIIAMRAVTATFQKQGERLEVPSGSCVAYGLDFLSTSLPRLRHSP